MRTGLHRACVNGRQMRTAHANREAIRPVVNDFVNETYFPSDAEDEYSVMSWVAVMALSRARRIRCLLHALKAIISRRLVP